MGTNCAPLLVDLLLYSSEAEFLQRLLLDNNKNVDVSFNTGILRPLLENMPRIQSAK
jgi:hypothetical protein